MNKPIEGKILINFIDQIILFYLHCYDNSRDCRDVDLVVKKTMSLIEHFGNKDDLFYTFTLNKKDDGNFYLSVDYILQMSQKYSPHYLMNDVILAIQWFALNARGPDFNKVANSLLQNKEFVF